MHDPVAVWNALLPPAPPPDERALEQALTALVSVGVQEETARALLDWLATSETEALVAVRPEALPPGIAGRDPLDLLLAAVEVSVLRVRLLAVCRWCGGVARRLSALCDGGPTFVCGPCALEQPSKLDVSIEAVFAPHRAFRRVEEDAVAAGPRFRLHHFHPTARAPDGSSYVEAVPENLAWIGDLEPGEEVAFDVVGGAGDVLELVALPAAAAHVVIVKPDGPPPSPAVVHPSGFDLRQQEAAPGRLVVKAGEQAQAVLALWIRRGDRRLQPASLSPLVPARALYFHPRARARLPDLVVPSQPLGVQDVTVWSSDLGGGPRVGEDDLEAWRRREQAFLSLQAAVVDQGGAVLMALGVTVLGDPDAPRLRLGLVRGPALAVESNGLADLYGRAVEGALRLSRVARPGELCVAAGTMDEELDATLSWWSRSTELLAAEPGEEAVRVHRMRLPGHP